LTVFGREQVLAVLAAIAGGGAAGLSGVPLGWLLGALGATALLATLGLKPKPPPLAREAGQSIVGLGIGLKTTAAALASAAALAPYVALALLYTLALTTAAALWLTWWAGVDRRTAFYATAAAGVAEMALLASREGGDPGIVSLVQALRVATIVTLVPALFFVAGVDGGLPSASDPPLLGPGLLALLAPLAGLAGFLASRLKHVPNPWLMGPLAIGMASGLMLRTGGTLPEILLVAAQLMLGITLGCRFDRPLLARLPRSLAAGLVIALALIAASAVGAVALSAATSLPFANAMLALAPAGIAEMALTAKVLHLDPLVVTAFHLPRILLILALVHLLAAVHDRIADRVLPADHKDRS
jgi:membrane AbrB-like protein